MYFAALKEDPANLVDRRNNTHPQIHSLNFIVRKLHWTVAVPMPPDKPQEVIASHVTSYAVGSIWVQSHKYWRPAQTTERPQLDHVGAIVEAAAQVLERLLRHGGDDPSPHHRKVAVATRNLAEQASDYDILADANLLSLHYVFRWRT
jgi:hypothetical protein